MAIRHQKMRCAAYQRVQSLRVFIMVGHRSWRWDRTCDRGADNVNKPTAAAELSLFVLVQKWSDVCNYHEAVWVTALLCIRVCSLAHECLCPNKVRCAVAASGNVVGQNLFYLRTKSDLQIPTSNLLFFTVIQVVAAACDQEISNILPLGISQSASAVNNQHLNVNQCDKNFNDRKHLWEKYIWFVLFWVFFFVWPVSHLSTWRERGLWCFSFTAEMSCCCCHLYIQSVNINQ